MSPRVLNEGQHGSYAFYSRVVEYWRSQLTRICKVPYVVAIEHRSLFFSIRFSPPLVISDEEMHKAIKIIGACLNDLDKVRPVSIPHFTF